MSLVRAGSDTIVTPFILNGLSLATGDSLTLTSNSDAIWYAIDGSAQAAYANASLSSLNTTGWKRYPDSSSPTGYLLEQWGTSGSIVAGASGSVTFPLVFPSTILTCSVTPIGSANNSNPGGGVGVARSLSGLTIYNWASAITFASTYVVKGY
ncbi:gp53-like domain-containing protein [Pseudomonas gingeri]|uniref:gp53-like domain-containing protein n=1 Tax=Pseudomonas gingeri TaxID=117681 RepID=UPI003F9F1A12